MAQLGEHFDPGAVEPRDNFDPIPAGNYVAEIIESDVVNTKSGSGQMVKLTWKITEGEYENRRIWDQINFRNANEVAQRIGQQSLAELCAACGIRGPLDDTEHLHGVPVRLRVKIGKAQDGYEARNEISRYAPYDEASAPAPARPAAAPARQAAPAAAPVKAAAGGGMPWRK